MSKRKKSLVERVELEASNNEPTVEELAAELFNLVELAQGLGFVSDGWGDLSREKFFAHARQAHAYTRLAAKQLATFLIQHKQMGSRKGGKP